MSIYSILLLDIAVLSIVFVYLVNQASPNKQ